MSLPWLRRVSAFVRKSTKAVTEARAPRPLARFFSRLWVEPLEERVLPSSYQWVGGSSANWNDPGNWSLLSGTGTFPNAPGDIAKFTGTYSAAQTVTVNTAITVGEIDFGSSRNITINASGSNLLTLDNTGTAANAVLDVGQSTTNSGTHLISAPLVVNSSTPLAATVTRGTLQLTNTATGATANVIGSGSTVPGKSRATLPQSP